MSSIFMDATCTHGGFDLAPKRHNYPSGREDQYVVRLPDGMRDRIKAAAEQNRRSMNSEIVFHLHRAITANPETKKADVTA